MKIEEMDRLLQAHIPLCAFMKLQIVTLGPASINTSAPLEPNRNMHGTGFAGALYSLAVATGWALVHNRLDVAGLVGQLVVKEATIHYKKPVTGDIELEASFGSDASDDDLRCCLSENGRLNFPLMISISSNGKKCGYLKANYVVIA